MNMFRSELTRWACSPEQMPLRDYASLQTLGDNGEALFKDHLPRGGLVARLRPDRERINYYMSPGELSQFRYTNQGQLLIGKLGNLWIGYDDDRPLISAAGARSGKTTTILNPNLFLYSGSMLVLDPKRELVQAAALRRALGHQVYVLDPFGPNSASFNPLAELDPKNPALIDDVYSVTNAIVPAPDGGGNAKHFADNARQLLNGLILLTMTLPVYERNLVTVRELLCLSYAPIRMASGQETAKAMAESSKKEKKAFFDQNAHAVETLLQLMAGIDSRHRFGKVAAGLGKRFLQTPPGERGSIFSTAATNTDFVDSLLVRKTLRRSDFSFAALRSDRPTTIFLCLPVGRAEQHYRWLRLLVQLACTVLERFGSYPRHKPGIVFMLEEAATLGHMDFMERAAAYFPGFGVKPWFVLQDITQLKTHYRGWQSILGNAGVVQLFGNGDGDSIDYATRRMGKLIEPWELETTFARERHNQLLLFKGRAPAAIERLSHDDVERIALRVKRDRFI